MRHPLECLCEVASQETSDKSPYRPTHASRPVSIVIKCFYQQQSYHPFTPPPVSSCDSSLPLVANWRGANNYSHKPQQQQDRRLNYAITYTSTASASAVDLDASAADIAAATFSSVSRDWLHRAPPSPSAEEEEMTEPSTAPPAKHTTQRGTAT